MQALPTASELGLPDAEVFPISAAHGPRRPAAGRPPRGLLPEGPFYFPPEDVSDQPEDVMLAELVREQVLRRTRQEVPHSVEVQVEEIEQAEAAVTVRATMWIETESQKGILIGAHGSMIKAIGTAARKEIERELGRARPPRPLRARPPLLARRRRAARPPRHHLKPTGGIGPLGGV